MGLIGTGIVAVLAAGVGYIFQLEDKWEQEYQEEAKKNVIRHSYELAQGYDVRLRKYGPQFILDIGKIADQQMKYPGLRAVDADSNGRIETYDLWNPSDNCKGDKDYKQYDSNMLLTALGKSTVCEREVALLRFANTDTLSKIERELLPYYGQKIH